MTGGIEMTPGKDANLPVKFPVGQVEAEIDAKALDFPVPSLDPLAAILDVPVSQDLVERVAQRNFLPIDPPALVQQIQRVDLVRKEMVVVSLCFLGASL